MTSRLAATRASEMRRLLAGWAIFAVLLGVSAWVGEVDGPKLAAGLPGVFDYFRGTLPVLRPSTLVADVQAWQWGLATWAMLILDTILMALLATLAGFVAAMVLAAFASARLCRNVAVRFVARRTLEFFRTIPDLVYALVFVVAFGIGPLAGVLALAVHSAGALGKLFYETTENLPATHADGILSVGGNWFDTLRWSVLPEVFPNLLSYGLIRLEINIRSATVMGFVGAGGIGMELLFNIRQAQYPTISAILLWIVLVVMLVDFASGHLRHRLTHARA